MGRDPERVQALDVLKGEQKLALRIDADGWPAALDGVDFLVNCAGPFADTAGPLVEAALKAGVNYIDTAGEPQVVRDEFERFGQQAQGLGLMVFPATGFYGALGDLLVAATADGWSSADRVELDFITDGWNPTAGTRAAAARMAGRRLVYSGGELHEQTGQPEFVSRDYGPPFGRQSVMQGYPSPEAILVPRHLAAPTVAIGMGSLAIRDLRNTALTGPRAGEKPGSAFWSKPEFGKGPTPASVGVSAKTSTGSRRPSSQKRFRGPWPVAESSPEC
jgi:hypothetical protein